MVMPVRPASSSGTAAATMSNRRLRRGLIARRGARGVGLRGDPRGDRAERGGAGVEALPQFGFDAGERRLVGRAETGALETVADQTDDHRRREADAHDAQDEGHESLTGYTGV